jgi:hypothetical protein
MKKEILIPALLLIIFGTSVNYYYGQTMFGNGESGKASEQIIPDALPKNVTMSGTYVCLPHSEQAGAQTEECAFGIKTDDGDYYAVNFGQSADQMKLFQSGAHVVAEGFVVAKEALSTDHWNKYNMKGIFTTTSMIATHPKSTE